MAHNVSRFPGRKRRMNEEHQQELYGKYPEIFKKRENSIYPICGGIDVGDGWYSVIRELCAYLDWQHKTYGVITRAIQVKEKFGGLRFYTDNDFDPRILHTKERKWLVNLLGNHPRLRWSRFGQWLGKFRWTYTRYMNQDVELIRPEKNFDITRITRENSGAICMTERMCDHICEYCGQPGEYRNDRAWVKVMCDSCVQKERADTTKER